MKLYSLKPIAMTGLAVMLLGGCAGTTMSKTEGGVLAGAATGALIGGLTGDRSPGRVAAGAAIGAAAGGLIGYSLDQQANDIARSLGTGVNNDPLAYIDPNQDLIVSNTGKYVKIMFRDSMMFPTDSSRMTSSASYKVGKVGRILRQYPSTIVEVAGYTDKRGTYDYNMRLSEERARSVADRLYAEGINNRSYVTGCSYSKPLVPNTSAKNMALNRRVEVYLYPNNDVRVNPCR